jgi:hypothetical protein
MLFFPKEQTVEVGDLPEKQYFSGNQKALDIEYFSIPEPTVGL